MSLADLLVSIAVLGLVLGGTFLLLQEAQDAYRLGEARVEAQQGVRLVLERMAAEIRGAGRSAAGVAFDAIGVAEPTRLTIQHDLDGDGVIAGTGERITYLLRDTTLRRDAGGGAQPMLNDVRTLQFTYLSADRTVTADPAAVRSVVVSISVAPTRRWRRWAVAVATAETEVRIRNR